MIKSQKIRWDHLVKCRDYAANKFEKTAVKIWRQKIIEVQILLSREFPEKYHHAATEIQ